MRDIVPAIIGGSIGVLISGYALVYLPMNRNYEQCGKVTLCPQPLKPSDPEYWRRAMCTQPKYQHLEQCADLRREEPQP